LPKIEASNKYSGYKISKNEIKPIPIYQRKYHRLFYIESPAMRWLLRRLKCDNYKTLVAASSIIRPGGKIRYDERIYRHNHPNQFEYFHKVLKNNWAKPGIMVYQEDVIKIALHFGGFACCRW
jgi:DNA polymerase III alpha subunit